MTQAKVTTLSPHEAWELVRTTPKAVLVDVRSNMEFLFIGHPVGAVNIAWIDEPDWKINPHFAADVRKLILGGLSHGSGMQSVPVVLICRSGKRSLEAGELLIREGFDSVFNVAEGFEGELDEQHHRSTRGGWRFHGLPWEQC
jgi:rhodanese-related sulfurtransferase